MIAAYAAAAVWQDLATRISAQIAYLDSVVDGLTASWTGEAADAARVAIADLRARFSALRLPAARTAELLAWHADVVAASPGLGPWSDAYTAIGLATLCPGPAGVRLWWDSLTAAQRAWLIASAPDRIGSLDGVPAADRDRANRLVLRRTPKTPALADLQRRLDGGALLMGLDVRGDGKAIVAFGDPDHADNVLTFVPGTHTALDRSLAGNLDRTEIMRAAALAADPSTSTAAVLWLGYDAPDNLLEAAQARYAHAARADLHAFQEGLVATHDGEIGEQSVVGYSYGALVVGETARDRGIAADDLVFLGAPGVGVEHAADLHVDPGTVWAASAGNDAVGLAAPSLRQLLHDRIWPRHLGEPRPDLWHGHNPADPGFGGHVFAAAGRANPIEAHLSYWDTGNPALLNVGRIAAGAERAVTPP